MAPNRARSFSEDSACWSDVISRFLGIDYGTKRIGLAVSDVGGCIASPLSVIVSQGDLAAQVREVMAAGREYEVEAYVLGLPLNMDGSVGRQAELTRAFGDLLARVSGLEVHYWDERLSSHGADVYLSEAALTSKKRRARRDAVAAQIILQSFLDARNSEQVDS